MKKGNKSGLRPISSCLLIGVFIIAGTVISSAQTAEAQVREESKPEAKVTGLRYICIHVLELEKTLKLYQEILGFRLDNAEVLKGGLDGMLVLKLKANDLTIALTVTPPELIHTLAPVGNTNHNHFMLTVNDIGPIGDKLKEEGYALENENYVRDKYTFFTGPNGEIVGLSAW